MPIKQHEYNQAIDNLSYLVLNYPKPIEALLAEHGIHFEAQPAKPDLVSAVIDALNTGVSGFSEALDTMMQEVSAQDNDAFWGTIAKGAVGLLGGLFKKKKRRSAPSSAGNAAVAQAAAAKRDMEQRMQQMREAQERMRQEAAARREREEERRRREAEAKKKAAAEKKKTNTLLLIGGGVLVLGIGAFIMVSSKRPQMPYSALPLQPSR